MAGDIFHNIDLNFVEWFVYDKKRGKGIENYWWQHPKEKIDLV